MIPLNGKGVGAVSFDFSVLQHSAKDIKTKYGDMIKETAKTLSGLLPPDKNRGSQNIRLAQIVSD